MKKVEYASGLNARLVHGTNTGRSVAGAPETTVASTSQPISGGTRSVGDFVLKGSQGSVATQCRF